MNRCPYQRYSSSVWTVLLGLLFLLSPLTLSQAQVPIATNITPTHTASLDLGTEVDTVGTTTEITGGTRPGSGTNLFHSFDAFTLGTGDTAHFLNDMQLPTNNIFGRVIGGEASKSVIDGTLRTNNPLDAADPMNFGAANLWLVNPSGLLLGPNARVEVGGSVSMSPANYLRFEGTATLFDMLSSPASLGPLSVAPVVAFGFLSPEPPAPITVQGSMLQVPEGQALSLVGGDITVQASTLNGTVQPARLSVPNGQIKLASTASPGEFDAATLDPLPTEDGTSFTSFGSVSLAPGSDINVSGASTVLVKGGQLVLSVKDATLSTSEIPAPQDTISLSQGSSILTSNSGAEPGADVQITVGNLNLDGEETVVTTKTLGDGNGGNITADVGKLSLTAGAQISSENASFGLGVGGDVQVSATDSILISGQDSLGTSSGILADTQISGDGGSISLTTKSLTMDQGGIITARTFGGGPGGEINIAVDTMSLNNGGRITSHTGSFAPGGNVNVTATDSIFLLSGVDSNGNTSGILSTSFFDGQTGNITVDTSKLTLTGGSVIQSGSIFDPQGGNISVNASNSVDISNGSSISSQALLLDVGNVSISTPTLTMDNGSIQSTTLDFGNAGNIVVNVRTLSLSGGARIDGGTSGSGHGGTITVQGFGGLDTRADAVKISGTDSAGNPSGLFTNAGSAGVFSNPFADGAGGDIGVFAKGLTIDSDGTVSAVSSSASTLAQGGSITVDANQVRLSSGSTVTSASTVAEGGAPGGNVEISAQILSLDSGASVSASTAGGGNAGNITIHSASTFVMENSKVTTEASQASGGQIEVTAPEMVQLINSEISTSVAGSKTDTAGGDITIDPQFVILQGGQIVARAFAGRGGNINITAGVFLADPNSVVDATSQRGISGEVNIQSPLQNVGGRLTPLSQQFSSAAALLAQQCAARAADGKFSTFVVAGREGLPVEPGGFIASPSLTGDLLGSSLSGRERHTQLSAVTSLFPKYDARPIQLAMFGNACRQ